MTLFFSSFINAKLSKPSQFAASLLLLSCQLKVVNNKGDFNKKTPFKTPYQQHLLFHKH